MTSQNIELIETTRKLHLKLGDRLTHYWIVIFISILPALVTWDLVKKLTGHYDGVQPIYKILIIGIIGLGLAIFFYILQSKRLKFYQIKTVLTEKEIEDAIKLTASQRNWTIVSQGVNYVTAQRQGNGTGSWGEQITIVFKTGHVLVNSICDPKKPSSVASFGQNKKNITALENNLKSANKGSSILTN